MLDAVDVLMLATMPRTTALTHFQQGLAVWLGMPQDDENVRALAVALLDVSKRGYQVVSAGHGSFKVYIEKGWLAGSSMELTDLPDPANRRPKG